MQLIVLVELIIATIILLPGFVFSLAVVAMSPMVFDAPGSEKRARIWLLFAAFLSAPVVIVVALIGGWALYNGGIYPAAIGVSLLPLLSVLIACAVFVLPDRS